MTIISKIVKSVPSLNFVYTSFFVVLLSLGLSACSAEVGSEKWCKNMDGKNKGDWSTNEAKDYAKSCVFK